MTDNITPINVDSILQSGPQYKSIVVDKEIKYDLGHLCAYDYNAVDPQQLKNDPSYLLSITRDTAQLMFTGIFQLPSSVVPDGVLAELPKPAFRLPRSKPLPESKEPTTWEKFAKVKGIVKKSRKPQLVWDETHQEYRRRYGYMKANNAEEQWLIPASDNHGQQGEGAVDPFTKMKQDKVVKADKQAEKEKKNKTEAKLTKARSQAAAGSKLKDDITRTFALVSRSTASMGRFDRRLPGEKEAPAMKGTRKMAGVGSAVGDTKAEQSSSLALVDKMIAKEDKLNKDRAATNFNVNQAQETRKRSRENILAKDKKKKSKKA